MCTRGLPDIYTLSPRAYTLSPRACGPWASGVYIRQTTSAHGITINCNTIANSYTQPLLIHSVTAG